MSTKRDHSDIDEGEVAQRTTKRQRKQPRQHQNSSIDPTWGQKYVFSNNEDATTIPAGEESDFEDDADAMAYLRSVRTEAMGIPHLLVAPKRHIGPQLPAEFLREDNNDKNEEPEHVSSGPSIYDNEIGDPRGFYQDGAYTARPSYEEVADEDYEDGEAGEEDENASSKMVCEAYFTSILNQYLSMRDIFHSEPPGTAVSRLPKSHPTEVNISSRKSSHVPYWTRLLRTTDPHPVQIALMSKDSVLRLLRMVLGGKFLRRGFPIPERTSRWLWALLARMPARDELNHSEIGWVRDLGRRAVLLGSSLAQMAALREELENGGLGVHEGVDESAGDEDVIGGSDEEANEGVVGSDYDDDQSTSEVMGQEAEGLTYACKDSQNQGQVDVEVASAAVVTPDQADDEEEGEVGDDSSDVAMDISSDEEGEVAEDLEDAKARLLAQLDHNESEDAEAAKKEAEEENARQRARINMRATLNMILTVAGEYYGQRDLLEFREPFVGM